MTDNYDVIIVGAGPAGSAAALRLADTGLKIALLDKARFPRDKICGDALSVDVINQLPMLSAEMTKAFEALPSVASYGVRIFSPDLTGVDIPFVHQGHLKNGYICARMDFDNLLLQQVKSCNHITVLEACSVKEAALHSDHILLHTTQGKLQCKITLGADGAHSVIRKLHTRKAIARSHHSAGLRVYYEGVTSFHKHHYIELYFLKNILPGYLWIFPMADGKANVGMGVLSSTVSEEKMDLKKILHELLISHPAFKERFAKARPLETVKGFGLPLGSQKRIISGERFLLLGDAAGLIDPFTGEGIANAIRSGRIAADHLRRCFQQQHFSAAFNQAYDQEIYRKMGKEFRVSKALQQLCRYPILFNYIARKANRSNYWHQFLINALADIDHKSNFIKPAFYYQLLFK